MQVKKPTVNIEVELSRCVNQLLLKEPFFAHVLAGTVRKMTTEIETAAVGFNNDLIMLMINEEFFLKKLRSSSERIAVLKHEVLHLVFRHLFRDKINEDMELFNVAADIVVNQYIGTWDLPENAVTLATFPDLNLIPEQELEYYYKILFELNRSILHAVSQDKNDAQNSDDGNDIPMHKKFPISAKALSEIYGKVRHSDHSKWVIKGNVNAHTADGQIVSSGAVSGMEQLAGKRLLDAFERTASKSYGTLHANLITQLGMIRDLMNPKIDWRRVLKIFSSSCGRTEIYHTMKRISKRYRTRPGIRIRKYKKIAVVVDTSGSIDIKILRQFFSEIDGIYKNGAQVIVIECDADIGNVYKYKKNTEIKVTGGGGTCYDPAFNYINKNNLRIDGCIYLTDGYAPEPIIKPRCRLLYIITPNGNPGPHLKWGKSIVITNL